MTNRVFGAAYRMVLLAMLAGLAAGCGEAGRSEDFATVDGKVTYQGTAVPSGSKLVLEAKDKGVLMTFDVGSDGKYTVNDVAQLPVGSYTVAVTPPPKESSGGGDYDAQMGGASATEKTEEKKDDYPVPEKFRSTSTSEKKIEVKAGAQTIDIDFK